MNIDISTLVSAWGWALLHFLWQGALIALVAGLLLRISRQAKPQIRYAIACIALMLCFLLPMSSVLRSFATQAQAETTKDTVHAISDLSSTKNAAFSGKALQETLHHRIPWVVIVWSLGCAFFSLRMALGLSWVANARRHCHANSDASLQAKLNVLAIQFELPHRIRLLICNDIDSPVTAGWWKPVVLIPAALAMRLTPDVVEALLAHELAHIKRHDYAMNLLQSAIEAVLFFHPAVWWLSKQIRIERENIADDLAAEILGEPRRLAVALAALGEFQTSVPSLTPAAQGGNLMSRIKRLMKPNQHVLHWKMSAVLFSLALVCLSVYAREKTVTEETPISESSIAEAADAASDISDVHAIDMSGKSDVVIRGENVSIAESDDALEVEADSVDVSPRSGKNRLSYAVVTAGKEGFMMSGSTDDIGAIKKARKNLSSDFLWFRRAGKAYVVQDPTVLAEVRDAWKDSSKISDKMELLSAKMDVHSNVMESISAKMQDVSNGGESQSNAMKKLSSDLQNIGSQQEDIGRQMEVLGNQIAEAKTPSQREALDKKMHLQSNKMAALDEKMKSLQTLMDMQSSQLDRKLQPLDALSKEMDIAAKPMEPLSKQMDVLGKQLEVLTKLADKKVVGIIEKALHDGQAVPAGKVMAQ